MTNLEKKHYEAILKHELPSMAANAHALITLEMVEKFAEWQGILMHKDELFLFKSKNNQGERQWLLHQRTPVSTKELIDDFIKSQE